MADPKIVKSSVVIKYRATDGYSADTAFGGGRGASTVAAHQPLLDAYAELARLLALFGYEEEARAAAEERIKAVADWRAEREASHG